jgi:predicted O-methyltransferase YrrM
MRPREIPDRIRYIREVFAPEDSVLADVDQRLTEYNMPIHIGAEEGKFLEFLIKLAGVKTIVEIGTLAGYSTVWMARALPEDGHIYTIEKDADRALLAKKTFATLESETARKITLCEGDAMNVLKRLSVHTPFDMLFIDADKIHYPEYLDWAERAVRKGGLIVGDNSFLFEAVYLDYLPEGIRPTAQKAMREFNKRLGDPERYTGIMLPTKEGLTLAIKQF